MTTTIPAGTFHGRCESQGELFETADRAAWDAHAKACKARKVVDLGATGETYETRTPLHNRTPWTSDGPSVKVPKGKRYVTLTKREREVLGQHVVDGGLCGQVWALSNGRNVYVIPCDRERFGDVIEVYDPDVAPHVDAAAPVAA